MKMLPALLGACGCIALGMAAAARLSAREKQLNAWEAALQHMEGEIQRGGAGLPRLFREAGAGQLPPLEQAAEIMETEPALSPEAMLSGLSWDPFLTETERETLEECLKGLFSPEPEAQLRSIGRAREQWAHFRQLSRECMERNTRLYTSLGWLAGAMVFILIC